MQVRETFPPPGGPAPGPRRTDDPIPYKLIRYPPGAADTLHRLQSEFPRASHDPASRRHAVDAPAKPVILVYEPYEPKG